MKISHSILSLLLAGFLASNCNAGEAQISGKVVKVADADTITVLDTNKKQHKIRFEGIDAPERGQAFGTKATDALKAAIGRQSVVVKVSGKDRYDRLIGTVFVGEKNLNEWLVANGWAWHYKQYSKDKRLADHEKKAKEARVGLWGDANKPMPPWDYRSAKRQQSSVQKGEASPTGYWLNSSSNVRHNSTCRYYRNTSKGRACGPKEGKGCGMCGG